MFLSRIDFDFALSYILCTVHNIIQVGFQIIDMFLLLYQIMTEQNRMLSSLRFFSCEELTKNQGPRQ